MRIKILDTNDNSPQFVKKSYQFWVKENLFKIPLYNNKSKIEVFDLDTSEKNSRLKFRLQERHNQSLNGAGGLTTRFSIDDTNYNYPVLILLRSFDFEMDGSSFEFTLVAYDGERSSDSALITIFIEDTNDNTPIFMNENATLVIKENMQINSFIGQV